MFGITLMGYYLGRVIPDVDKYLLPIVLGIIVTSFVPSIIHISQEKKSQKKIESEECDVEISRHGES